MSRLLESFAADEGFQMDGSSFSEEDEDNSHSYYNKSPQSKRGHWGFCKYLKQHIVSSHGEIFISIFASPCAVPNCVLTKELLTDGLKVLVSKEDELLYAARVHTLEIPDM